jgi:hypothetical protein
MSRKSCIAQNHCLFLVCIHLVFQKLTEKACPATSQQLLETIRYLLKNINYACTVTAKCHATKCKTQFSRLGGVVASMLATGPKDR